VAAAEPGPLGVGIDLEQRDRFVHLSEPALRHAAERWLTADERAWCGRQGPLAEPLVIVLSCKEAVFKAWPVGRTVHQVTLDALEGSAVGGRAVSRQPVQVEVRWMTWRQHVLTLAVAIEANSAPRPAESPGKRRRAPASHLEVVEWMGSAVDRAGHAYRPWRGPGHGVNSAIPGPLSAPVAGQMFRELAGA
jgi:phosphopantetheinyl transferase (holo-ACP synthase)